MTKTKPKKGSLEVWWIPQVPGKAFRVPVKNIQEATKIMDVLADYDTFQFEENIKPDYSNAGGLEVFDGKDWEEWSDEEGRDIDEHRWAKEE